MNFEKTLAILGLLACLFIAGFAIRNLLNRLNTNDIETKIVSHSVGIAIFTVVVGLIMAVVSSFGLLGNFESVEPDGWVALLPGLIMGLLISGFMAPSLSSSHDIYWNDETLEGPSKLFGPSLRGTRTKLKWEDVVSNGTVVTGYSYVEVSSGERIYYSPYSKGLKAFKTKLSREM